MAGCDQLILVYPVTRYTGLEDSEIRKEILHPRLLMVEGRLQREGQVVHVIVSKCFDFTKMLSKLVQREADELPVLTLARGDEKTALQPGQIVKRIVLSSYSRDFQILKQPIS